MNGERLLEVGDILITETFLGKNRFPITRVTKTLAKSRRDSDGFEQSFKREISFNMSHPYQQWNTVTYSVERKTPV